MKMDYFGKVNQRGGKGAAQLQLREAVRGRLTGKQPSAENCDVTITALVDEFEAGGVSGACVLCTVRNGVRYLLPQKLRRDFSSGLGTRTQDDSWKLDCLLYDVAQRRMDLREQRDKTASAAAATSAGVNAMQVCAICARTPPGSRLLVV
jgi:hypothetical protein